jgi:glutathione-regulated potassium-efflux system ancillary protein KefF
MARIVVIAAHPQREHSRTTDALMRAAARLPAGQVDVRDLYALYPDYLIDVPAEQQALAAAELLVWLHPVHWYGMPPLLKLWLDEVFAFGWAYGPGGRALAGKALWLAASTGAPAESYTPAGSAGRAFADFLHPYTQTAALVQMRWLPPLLLHGAHRASAAQIEAHARHFADRLAAWPDAAAWPDLAGPTAPGLPVDPALETPADTRPAP